MHIHVSLHICNLICMYMSIQYNASFNVWISASVQKNGCDFEVETVCVSSLIPMNNLILLLIC